MAFVKKTWKDRIAEFPTRRRITKSNGDSELVTVTREEGTISQEGDAFSAENMNDLESRVNDAISEINSNLENKVHFIDYGNMITVSTNPYTVTEDVYVQYIHLSSSASIPFLVNNVTVSVSDKLSSPKMFVDTFNGLVKKGSALSCSDMTNNTYCKIFKLS